MTTNELLALAQIIKSETVKNKNSALRIGTAFEEVVKKLGLNEDESSEFATKTEFDLEKTKRLNQSIAAFSKSSFSNFDGTEITGAITGYYTFGQAITESPSYTASGRVITYTNSTAEKQLISCKGVDYIPGSGYRTVLICDSNNVELYKTDQFGDMIFVLNAGWKIQVSCEKLYVGGTFDNTYAKNKVIKEDINNLNPLSNFIIPTKSASITKTDINSWVATPVLENKTMEGMTILTSKLVYGTITSGNILGYNLASGITATIGKRALIYFSIYTDVKLEGINWVLDNSLVVTINDSNLPTTLEIGWNYIWMDYTFIVNNPTTNFLVINSSAGNIAAFSNKTIFATSAVKTNNRNYKLIDYTLSLLTDKINVVSDLKLDESNSFKTLLDANLNFQQIKNIDGQSWEGTSTFTQDTTKTFNGVTLKGCNIDFGILTTGENTNIWGINLKNGNRTANTVLYLKMFVWSDSDIAGLTPSTIFTSGGGATILEHNFDSLKAGWNFKFVKLSYTVDSTGGLEYFLFTTSGALNFANKNIFIAYPILSDFPVSMLDYNLATLFSKTAQIPDILDVPCFGDSLTAGAGADKTTNKATVISKLQSLGITTTTLESSYPTYPITMQAILGSKYNVVNCGVGGENINTIAARQGAAPILVPKQFVLSQTAGTVVEIADSVTDTLKSSFDGISTLAPLLQGTGNSVNPCYIEGIECTLSVVTGTPNRYKLTRTTNGTRDVTISAGTSLILQGAKVFRNPKAAIVWCWQNGGYADNNDLIIKLDKIVSNLGTSNFIIVGLHSGTEASNSAQESALQSKYGDRFFNWRKYLATNALYDFGITPTTDADLTAPQIANDVKSDTYQMSIGALPSSLWRSVYGVAGDTSNDNVHMNAAGYMILGYKLIERLKIIGAF